MNNDEQQLINQFFERVSGEKTASPNTVGTASPLPPIDSEANQLINSNLQKYPEAGYRMTQMAIVQEAALVESQNRIRQLEWQLQQMQQQIQQLKQAQAQSSQPRSGGFLGGLFGGGNRSQTQMSPQSQQMPPGWGGNPNRPQPQTNQSMNTPYGQQQPPAVNYPPGYQRGMFNRGGDGFLGSALSTAAGVAGGMMAYNALSGLFGGHHAVNGAAPMSAADPNDPFAGTAGGSDPFTGEGTAVDPNFDAGNNSGAGFDNYADDGFSNSGNDTDWGNSGDSADWGSDDGGDWGGDDGGWGDDSF
ncbi:DUF2076 domain-containing protein [Commensalibacter melissae]|uniref:DUF2076 domain-containing protein n=1 Tax=Commensalibacter melissae TaxID=2070537 RepID=UPI0012D9ED79|nr:DUF2076 domain-containing protein [Commensalibacter melissae]MUG81570.1 DUF2076 family protein [Commensalibacter melissae]